VVLRKLNKGSLEQAMYDFHRANQVLTLRRIKAVRPCPFFQPAKEIQSSEAIGVIVRR
jgi:hypothetical protein